MAIRREEIERPPDGAQLLPAGKDLAELAAEQGVRPVQHLEELAGDFWPEDETADDFIRAYRQWRREEG